MKLLWLRCHGAVYLLAALLFLEACEPASTPAAPDEPARRASKAIPTCTPGSLQALAERALSRAGHPGAVIVLELPTGKELALAQTGSRSTMRVHPASTTKPIVALAALRAGELDPLKKLSCTGAWEGEHGKHRCFAVHGELDLATALATSCNVYSARVAESVGPKRVAREFESLGLRAYADAIRHSSRDGHYDVPTMLGHGDAAVSPRELAHAYAKLVAASREFPAIRQGLGMTVSPRGTGRAAAIRGLDVAGKTGSSLAYDGKVKHLHAWFAAYAPANDPQLLVLAYLYGDKDSFGAGVPVARDVLDGWHRGCPGLAH